MENNLLSMESRLEKKIEDSLQSRSTNSTSTPSTLRNFIKDDISEAKQKVMERVDKIDNALMGKFLTPLLQDVRNIYRAAEPLECIESEQVNTILNAMFVVKKKVELLILFVHLFFPFFIPLRPV